MITHVVSFRWKADTSPDQLVRIQEALASLPALIPKIVTYQFGSDLGVHGSGNMDFAIVATFESIDDWRLYDTHPDHDRVRADVIRPWIAERAAVQFHQ